MAEEGCRAPGPTVTFIDGIPGASFCSTTTSVDAAKPFNRSWQDFQRSSMRRSPPSTCWTLPMARRATVPSRWAVMDASIFIASIVATV